MFDVGWTELVVVAVVAILVVGPKDLPGMLRTFGKTVSQLRRMAGDFQRQFDDALKEAELDDVKKIASSKTFQPLEDARKSMLDFQKDVNQSVKELEETPETKPAAETASPPKADPVAEAGSTQKPKPARKPAAHRKKPSAKAKAPAEPADGTNA
ncbi:MAG: twin-arginine translocase subunit TatB [Nitratireductor sp.]|nr:twin-arginine translocase subunit TatB [Nitratireductor sp.]